MTNETGKTESYDVTFTVLMPGSSKKMPYTITVEARNHADALVAAESKYLEQVLTYDIASKKNNKKISEVVLA